MKQFGYEYYTWFDLAIIAACLIGVGVIAAVIATHLGVFDVNAGVTF